MKADQHIYEFMYNRIPDVIRDREVLELATGPGLLAKHIAPALSRLWSGIGKCFCQSEYIYGL